MNPACLQVWAALEHGETAPLEQHAATCPACMEQWRVHRTLSRALAPAAHDRLDDARGSLSEGRTDRGVASPASRQTVLPALGPVFDAKVAARTSRELRVVPLSRAAKAALLLYWLALAGAVIRLMAPAAAPSLRATAVPEHAVLLVPIGFALAMVLPAFLRRAAAVVQQVLSLEPR